LVHARVTPKHAKPTHIAPRHARDNTKRPTRVLLKLVAVGNGCWPHQAQDRSVIVCAKQSKNVVLVHYEVSCYECSAIESKSCDLCPFRLVKLAVGARKKWSWMKIHKEDPFLLLRYVHFKIIIWQGGQSRIWPGGGGTKKLLSTYLSPKKLFWTKRVLITITSIRETPPCLHHDELNVLSI
jgi:hypothetical protein